MLVLGAGTVGANAAKVAAGFGANIGLLDTNLERLRYLDDVTPPNIDCLYSDRHTIREWLSRADLVIGSVLIPGARAPHLVERDDLRLMKPGSVIIDVAIDQGGCIATSRPTSHAEPTFVVENVVHYCVTNMPGLLGEQAHMHSAMQPTHTFSHLPTKVSWPQHARTQRFKRLLISSMVNLSSPRWRNHLASPATQIHSSKADFQRAFTTGH